MLILCCSRLRHCAALALRARRLLSAALKEEDRKPGDGEEDERAGLVDDLGAEVGAGDAVPGGTKAAVEALLERGGQRGWVGALLQGLLGQGDGRGGEAGQHVRVLDLRGVWKRGVRGAVRVGEADWTKTDDKAVTVKGKQWTRGEKHG